MTEQDILDMGYNTLAEAIKEMTDDAERFGLMEQAIKIVLNGGYGYVGTAYSRYFDLTIAEAVTSTGQVGIRYITKKLNEFVNDQLGLVGEDQIDVVISSDTDSCFGTTILTTSIGKITIEDLYNQYTSIENELKQDKKDSVRTLNKPINSASFDGNSKSIVMNNINYIMKHTVKKRMFKIKVKGKEVIVTEDHSVMVIRNDQLISVKPKDILKTDKMIALVD